MGLDRMRFLAAGMLLVGLGFAVEASADPVKGAEAEGAGRAPFTAQVRPTLAVPLTTGAITVDGDLDDPGWHDAARVSGFSENDPGDNAEPAVATEVLVAYDQRNFYMAFIAEDDPGAVRARLCNRDEIWSDDYIGIMFDPYDTGAWAYEVFVNPLGIQGDLRWLQGGEEDISFDMIFHSRGKVTATGYQVEVAIPFRSLRFPERTEQRWRATFWRDRQREHRYRYAWSAVDRDEPCWICNFGTLTGMGGVSAGRNIEVIPAVVATQVRELRDPEDLRSGLASPDGDLEPSLGVRYGVTSSATLEATLNPDYSQIESDAAQIDVNTTFALSYPEKRPFFQEGSDLFSTWMPAVYSRSIDDPSVAGKLILRSSGLSFGWTGARDETTPVLIPFGERSALLSYGKSTVNVLRARREIGDESHIGALVTDRRYEHDGSGTLLSVDGAVRFLRSYRLKTQVIWSLTREPGDSAATAAIDPATFDGGAHTAAFDGERFWGRGMNVSVSRDARIWNANLAYVDHDPRLRTPAGFLTRNDDRLLEGWSGLFFRPNRGILTTITPSADVARLWTFDGTRKDEWLMFELNASLRGATEVEAEKLWSREVYQGIHFDGIQRWSFAAERRFHPGLFLVGKVETGRSIARREDPPVLGRLLNVSLDGSIRPMHGMLIEPSYEYARLRHPSTDEDIFSGSIYRVRTSYQITREANMRMIVQYDDFDTALAIEPLFSYKANPFTIFYIGWNESIVDPAGDPDPVTTGRQFFLKMQYLLRV